MQYEELKQKLDNMKPEKALAEVKDNHGFAEEAYGDFVLGLYYFERTERFRDISRYKRSTFRAFLGAEFGMAESRYQALRFS